MPSHTPRHFRLGRLGAIAIGALALAAPAAADVRDGVEAWSRGDYAAAVAEWRGPADAGDADAMFNLGQAYRLGRGVAQDDARAEALYKRASEGGHVQAADTYGLMLFQAGRRQEALPLVEGAARRGDPRAQYLLGIAHFNGDIVARDWERAYALLTLANAAGLPQAGPAIEQMDQHIPLAQRQQAAGLARQMQTDAASAREVELASVDLGTAVGTVPGVAPGVPSATPPIPRPIPTTGVSPSIAAAQAAVAEARSATGTEDPANAGASYARGPAAAARPPVTVIAAAPTPTPSPRPTARPVAPPTPAPPPAPAPAVANGPWRVQLGAFSVRSNAEALWTRLSRRPELAGHERLLVPAGRVTKLQAGGFATQAAAQSACRTLQAAGQDCIVTRN